MLVSIAAIRGIDMLATTSGNDVMVQSAPCIAD